MRDYSCVKWNEDEEMYELGEHGQVDKIIVKDAYFIAGELSSRLPNNQYINERDLEMVDFTVDVSGDEITGEDVRSSSRKYLEKFPNIYEAVAEYVKDLEEIPVGRIKCPKCDNDVDYSEVISD